MTCVSIQFFIIVDTFDLVAQQTSSDLFFSVVSLFNTSFEPHLNEYVDTLLVVLVENIILECSIYVEGVGNLCSSSI